MMIKPVFKWNLKYTYAGKIEHALIYISKYRGYEIVQEISTKKKYGKFGVPKIIYYESTSKPVFRELSNLLAYVRSKPKNKSV